MLEEEQLRPILREWETPSPSAAMDQRMLAAYRRRAEESSVWARFWRMRISIPAPVLAGLLLVLAALWIQYRIGEPARPLPRIPGYVTRIDATGFVAIPDGAARVVRREEVRQ